MREKLTLMTRLENGTDVPFAGGLELTEYTLTKSRMGLPSLTAKVKYPTSLKDQWTGREHVTCQGETYWVRSTPSVRKSNTDARWEHDITFACEREVLGQVYFFDTVTIPAGEDYKPRSNSSSFSFYGTLREFCARLNCALAYAGIADSALAECSTADFISGHVTPNGDGYITVVDDTGGWNLDEEKELNFDDRYIIQTLQDAYETYGVPFSFRGRRIVFGEKEHVVSTPMAQGMPKELLTINKVNKMNLIVNEVTGYGSSENIPYYYPNDTEFGVVQLGLVSSHTNEVVGLNDITLTNASRLTSRVREGVPVVCHYIEGTAPYFVPNDAYKVTVEAEYGNHIENLGTLGMGDSVNIPQFSDFIQSATASSIPVRVYLSFMNFQPDDITIRVIWQAWTPTDLLLSGDIQSAKWRRDGTAQWQSARIDRNSGIKMEIVENDGACTYTLCCELHFPTSGGTLKISDLEIDSNPRDTYYWTSENKKFYDLSKIGVSLGVEPSVEMNGDMFLWNGHDRMPFQDKLVIPKYRDTLGAERFYRALNTVTGTYAHAYEGRTFPRPYTEGNPSQSVFTDETIKPTIDGIRNDVIIAPATKGQLFGEIAAVAFDDTDSDALKMVSDSDGTADAANYEHSFFYIKLHRLRYVSPQGVDYSLDLFAMASQKDPMTICMTSGKCAGCKFKIQAREGTGENAGLWLNPVQTENGNIVAGDYGEKVGIHFIESQQDTSANEVWICVQKDTETFGVIMPNRSGNCLPQAGDRFNIVNIDLPKCYIIDAEERLEKATLDYMEENNSEKWNFEVGVSRIWCKQNPTASSEIDEYGIIEVEWEGETYRQYVNTLTIECKDSDVLPELKIDLDDEVAAGTTLAQRVASSALSMSNAAEKKTSVVHIDTITRPFVTPVDLPILTTTSTAAPTDANVYSALRTRRDFLSRVADDVALGRITFAQGAVLMGVSTVGQAMEFGRFVAGTSGAFMGMTPAGSAAEVDFIKVRKKAQFETLEIAEVKTIGGKLVVSPGDGVELTAVEDDGDGWICSYRVSETQPDGTERKIEGKFQEGDQIYCKLTNARQGDNSLVNRYWWRLCTAAGDGWFRVSATDCDGGSDAPQAGDRCAQLGSRTDLTRQSAIVLSTAELTASPLLALYGGIDSYSLEGKDCVTMGSDPQGVPMMNVYGQMYVGPRDGSSYLRYTPGEGVEVKARLSIESTVGSQTLADYIAANSSTDMDAINALINAAKADLQAQIDGAIETWYYEGEPTLANAPASGWTDDAEKDRHIGDLYYDKASGYAYRFLKEDGVYKWVRIADTDITAALAAAAEAQETADGKMTVFAKQPTPPYQTGDIWVNATYGTTYRNDILRCVTAKGEGGSFDIADWTLASRYTDDSALASFISGSYADDIAGITGQLDQKAETWYQSADPSAQWSDNATKELHLGDIWYNTTADENGNYHTYIYRKANGSYGWVEVNGVPKDVFDMADGKASIYVSQPSSYKKNDLWILEMDYTLFNNVSYSSGTIVIALQDSDTWDASHWTKRDRYTDDTVANAAASAAQAAQEAADRIASWAEDGVISPVEMQQVEDEIRRIESDHTTIEAQCASYGIKATATLRSDYNTAYTAYHDDLTAITTAQPDDNGNVAIPKDMATHSAAYYQTRAAILTEIAAKAKAHVDAVDTKYAYLKEALADRTTIEGGLILTSTILLGKDNVDSDTQQVNAGINGIPNDGAVGGGIAAFYGGDMHDLAKYYTWNESTGWTRNNVAMPEGTRIAKGLDRFDGTGYRAGGNLWWDADGKVHADPTSFFVGEKTMGNSLAMFDFLPSASSEWGSITAAIPQKPLRHITVGEGLGERFSGVRIDYDADKGALHIHGNVYADGFVSALGSSSGGGSGSGEGSGGGMDESALADWMQQHISEYLPDHSGLATEQWVGDNYVEASLYNQNVQTTNQAISDINEAFSAINGNFSSIQSGFNQLVTDMSGLLPKSGGALDAAVVNGGSMAGGFLGFKDASEQANGTEDTKAKMLLHPDIGLVMHKDEDSWVAVTDDGFIPYNEAGGEPTMDLGRNGNRWRELHVKGIICNGVRVERKDYGFIRTAITEVDGRKRYRIHFGNDDHYIEYEEGRGFHFSHGLYSEGFVTAYGNDNGEGSAIDIPQVVDNGDGTITISVGDWSVTVWDTTADIPIENVDGLDERLTEDEGRIDEVEDEQQAQGQSIATLRQQIGEHAQRFVDLGQRVDGAESGLGRVGADLMTKADQSDVDDLGSSLDELRTVVGGHTTDIAGLRVDLGTAQDEINATKAALGTKANSSDLDAKADKSGLLHYKAVSVSGKNALRVVTDVPKSYAGSVRIHIMGTADGEQIDTMVVAVRTPSRANAAAKWAGSTLSNAGYDISKVTLTTAAEGGTDYIAFVVKKSDGYGNAKMLLVNVQTDEADGNTGTHVLKTYYDAAETTDKRELDSRRHVWESELPTRVSDLQNDTIPIVKVEGGVLKIDDAEQGLSWSKITNRPTTVSGYGIADLSISSGKITIGGSSITPITSHQSLSGYATQSWVTDKGYLTSHQSITVDDGMIKVGGVDLIKPYAGTYVPTADDIGIAKWAQGATKPSYTASEVGARPSDWMPTAAQVGARPSSWMPTATEVGVPAWAQATSKPTYTASEVGARPSSWTPTASDVGARPSSWTPTAADVGVTLSNGKITIGNSSITPITSHQSLSGYATQSWVTGKGYLTSHQAITVDNGMIKVGGVDLIKPYAGTYVPTAAQVGARPSDWMPTAADVGARPSSWMPTAAQVGARPSSWMPTATEVGVPDWAQATSKPTYTAADVGARPSSWTPTAAEVGARPNTWTPTAADVGVTLSNGKITIGNSSITPITSHQSLSGYATQSWVSGKGYLTSHQSLAGYAKTSDLSSYALKSAHDDLADDVALIKAGAGLSKPSGSTGYTNTTFVKKTGDTISGRVTIQASGNGALLTLNNTDNEEPYISLQRNGTYKAAFSHHPTYGASLYSAVGKYLGITDAGVPHFHGSTLLYAGNYGSYVTKDYVVGLGLPYAKMVNTNTNFGGSQTAHTTAEFIQVLSDNGMLAAGRWIWRTQWYYAYNWYITDTGCGDIQLAGSTIEVTSNGTEYEVKITTAPTVSNIAGVSATPNAVFVYRNNGSGYSPNWKRLVNSDALANYLPLSGGALTGSLSVGGNVGIGTTSPACRLDVTAASGSNVVMKLKSAGNGHTWIRYDGTSALHGYLGFNGENSPAMVKTDGSTVQPLLHSGNWSTYCAAASHTHSYLPLSGGTLSGRVTIQASGSGALLTLNNTDNEEPYISLQRNGTYKAAFSHHPTYGASLYSTAGKYLGITDAGVPNFNGSPLLYAGNYGSYVTKSYVDGLGVSAAKAEKLVTSRTLWGQSFDGSANVDGVFRSLTDASDGQVLHSILKYPTSPYGLLTRIYNSGAVSLQNQRETTTSEYFGLSLNPLGGDVGIGTTSPSYKLHVVGTLYASGAATFNSTLSTTGKATLASMGVTGAATVGGALGVTGNLTVSGTTTLRNVMVGRFADTTNNVARVDSTVTATGGFLCDKAAGTYINGCKEGCLKTTYSGYGSAVSMPAKGGRLAIATYPSNDNRMYFTYGTTANITNNTNSTNNMSWDGAANKLYVGALDVTGGITSTGLTVNGAASLNQNVTIHDTLTVSTATNTSQRVGVAAGGLVATGQVSGATLKATDFISIDHSGKGDNVGDGWGLSLYNKTTSGCPTWGIFMGKTATYGGHGSVTTDGTYAMYFTINGAYNTSPNRGWVFQNRAYPNGTSTKVQNVFSISGLGNMRVSGSAYVVGTAYIGGATTMDSNLQVNGRIDCDDEIWSTTGVKSSGYVTALSDERLKEGFTDACPDTADVAALPAVEFSWRRDGRRDMGSIAQAMVRVLPLCVHKDKDGWLSIDYGKAATMCAISVARKSTEHERRIAALERQINELQHELETLKAQ